LKPNDKPNTCLPKKSGKFGQKTFLSRFVSRINFIFALFDYIGEQHAVKFFYVKRRVFDLN